MANPNPQNQFGSERAKELVKLAIAKRIQNAERLKQADSINRSLSAYVVSSSETGESFRLSALARVRKQMERLLDKIEKETDPAMIDRIAAALARLEVIEQKLSMRGAPAAIKQQVRKSSHTSPVEPDEPS